MNFTCSYALMWLLGNFKVTLCLLFVACILFLLGRVALWGVSESLLMKTCFALKSRENSIYFVTGIRFLKHA